MLSKREAGNGLFFPNGVCSDEAMKKPFVD
jgi:hypothetical protein